MNLDTEIMEYLHKNTDWSLEQIAIVGSQVKDDNAEWAYNLVKENRFIKNRFNKKWFKYVSNNNKK